MHALNVHELKTRTKTTVFCAYQLVYALQLCTKQERAQKIQYFAHV